MSATLDAILAATRRLVDRPVLYVAKNPINYQRGRGPGRPVYSHSFLLVHPTKEGEEANGRLPASVHEVVPDDVRVDDAGAEIDGVQIVRCAAEFEPRLGDKYDRADWLPADFVIGHPWSHPRASRAVESFERAQTVAAGDRRDTKGRELGRGIYFDQPPEEIVMDSIKDFRDAQAAAEPTYRAFGDSAPAAMQGESLPEYEGRLVRPHQPHSKNFGAADLAKIGCPVTRRALAAQIYSDATAALRSGAAVPAGQLRPIKERDPSGREITRYVGDIAAFMDQFNPPIRYITKFMTSGRA